MEFKVIEHILKEDIKTKTNSMNNLGFSAVFCIEYI